MSGGPARVEAQRERRRRLISLCAARVPIVIIQPSLSRRYEGRMLVSANSFSHYFLKETKRQFRSTPDGSKIQTIFFKQNNAASAPGDPPSLRVNTVAVPIARRYIELRAITKSQTGRSRNVVHDRQWSC